MFDKHILNHFECLKKASHSTLPMHICTQALLTLSTFLLSSNKLISVIVVASISAGTRSCTDVKVSQYPGAGVPVPLEDC